MQFKVPSNKCNEKEGLEMTTSVSACLPFTSQEDLVGSRSSFNNNE